METTASVPAKAIAALAEKLLPVISGNPAPKLSLAAVGLAIRYRHTLASISCRRLCQLLRASCTLKVA